MGPLSVLAKKETQITLSWAALSGALPTGNSEILSYNLYWDDSTNTEPSVKLYSGLLTEFQIKGTVGGQTYQFAVRAQNVFGEGLRSELLTQTASDIPE